MATSKKRAGKSTESTQAVKAEHTVEQKQTLTIKAFNKNTVVLRIVGSAPYVQHKFSEKTRRQMMEKQQAGSTAQGKKNRVAKDFMALYEAAQHKSEQGWGGIPAPAFRAGMISACRLVGFQMTKAKLSVFVPADGIDADDGTPLVRIHGTPEPHEGYVRNETGVVDIRCRPMWRKWWADVTVRWDGDQFTIDDVVNLLNRAGQQVGVGEGRPDSKKSAGCGWGTYEVVDVNPNPKKAPEGF